MVSEKKNTTAWKAPRIAAAVACFTAAALLALLSINVMLLGIAQSEVLGGMVLFAIGDLLTFAATYLGVRFAMWVKNGVWEKVPATSR